MLCRIWRKWWMQFFHSKEQLRMLNFYNVHKKGKFLRAISTKKEKVEEK